MIVVKVELWPAGDAKRAKTLKELLIANQSQLAEVSDYAFAVYDGEEQLPERGGHVRHTRADGVMKLLAHVWKEMGL
jgi:hypothetical protein